LLDLLPLPFLAFAVAFLVVIPEGNLLLLLPLPLPFSSHPQAEDLLFPLLFSVFSTPSRLVIQHQRDQGKLRTQRSRNEPFGPRPFSGSGLAKD
jgi:hypothetical protein